MAVEAFGAIQSFNTKNGGDLHDKQYYIVKLDTTANTVVIAGQYEGDGILQNEPKYDATNGFYEAASVLTASGVKAKVVAGDAIANIGTAYPLEADSSGRAVAFTRTVPGTTATKLIGYPIEAASAAGQIITIVTCFAPDKFGA